MIYPLNPSAPTEQPDVVPATLQKSPLAIDNHSISFKQVLQWLRSTGKLPMFLQELIGHYVIEQELQQRTDLEIDVLSVQQAIANFRQQQNLEEPHHYQRWLTMQGWDEEIFQKQVLFNLKLDKFKQQIAAPKLLDSFMEHKLQLDRVVLSRIVVQSQDLAEELKMQVMDDGASFEQLAQEYSQADDSITKGLMGVVSRADIQSWLGVDLYQTEIGQIIGPIAHEQEWYLIRVETLLPAELNDSVHEYLQEQIFQQWLAAKVQTRSVDLRLSDPPQSL